MEDKDTKSKDPLFQAKEIDKLIHEPARLSIIAVLYVVESADFVALRTQTGLSDGNLSAHLSKLEDAGYVEVEKKTKAKKSLTMLKLSEKGRKAFDDYRKKMTRVLTGLNGK